MSTAPPSLRLVRQGTDLGLRPHSPDSPTLSHTSSPDASVASPLFLPWQDLSKSDVASLSSCRSAGQRRRLLGDLLRVDELYAEASPTPRGSTSAGTVTEERTDPRGLDTRRQVFLDLCSNAWQFTRDQGFSTEKTSAFVSLVKRVHLHCVADPQPALAAAFAEFERLLLQHSVQRPPFSVAVFTFPDVKAITTYMSDTYFLHLKLYQFVYGPHVELDMCVARSLAEAPNTAALAVGLDEAEESALVDEAEEEVVAEEEPAAADAAEQEAEVEEAPALQVPDGVDPAEFEAAVRAETKRLREEMTSKLRAQQEEFAQRLAALEGRLDSS